MSDSIFDLNLLKEGIDKLEKIIPISANLDNSLVKLARASGLSAKGLADITKEAYKLGDAVGQNGTKVLDSITIFQNAGYNIADSMKYAEEALKASNISETIKDTGQSAANLIQIMKGFKNESPEFASKINDALTEVSISKSISFDELSESSARLSESANQAGLSLEQMLGMLAGANDMIGDVGQTADAQAEIYDNLSKLSSNTSLSSAISDVIGSDNFNSGNLSNTYDMLENISDVWETLEDTTKNSLSTQIAGLGNEDVFQSLMENWNGIEQATLSATDSFGSAERENSRYVTSIQGKMENLNSAYEKLTTDFVSSDLLKWIIDFGTGAINSIDAVIDKFGVLTSIGLGAGVFGITQFVKNFA